MAKIRKRLTAHVPVWNGFYDGYITNFLTANYWRVKSNMEYEDAFQEAKLVFVKLVSKYGNVDTPQHFMALYKTSWINRFNDLSKKDTRCRRIRYEHQQVVSEEGEERDYQPERGFETCDGMLSVMIQQAPAEIKSVLRLFLTTPVEVLDLLAKAVEGGCKSGEFNDQQLCTILGLRKGTKVKEKINNYFRV